MASERHSGTLCWLSAASSSLDMTVGVFCWTRRGWGEDLLPAGLKLHASFSFSFSLAVRWLIMTASWRHR